MMEFALCGGEAQEGTFSWNYQFPQDNLIAKASNRRRLLIISNYDNWAWFGDDKIKFLPRWRQHKNRGFPLRILITFFLDIKYKILRGVHTSSKM